VLRNRQLLHLALTGAGVEAAMDGLNLSIEVASLVTPPLPAVAGPASTRRPMPSCFGVLRIRNDQNSLDSTGCTLSLTRTRTREAAGQHTGNHAKEPGGVECLTLCQPVTRAGVRCRPASAPAPPLVTAATPSVKVNTSSSKTSCFPDVALLFSSASVCRLAPCQPRHPRQPRHDGLFRR
jgi:hypothetical protein